MKVEVDVLSSPVSNSPYDVFGRKATLNLNSLSLVTVQELCESGGGRPGFPVSNSPYDVCGRKATPNEQFFVLTVQGSLLVTAGEEPTLAKGLNLSLIHI